MSQGEVRKREWKYNGKRREAWGFTVVIGGKRVRRSGYGSRAEAQEALDELKHPAPVATAPVASITLGEAVERFLAAKSRNKSLAETKRLLDGLVAYFGADTPLPEITANRIAAWQAEKLATVSRQTGNPLSPAAINRRWPSCVLC